VHGAARVAHQQGQGAAADRLGKGLGPQVCRLDRAGFGDDVRAAILVARDRQRKTESEEQPDNAQQRGLQDPEWLFEALRKVPDAAAQENPEARRAEDYGKDE